MSVNTDYDRIYERLEFVPWRAPERLPREMVEDFDPAIREAVCILHAHGIETCQSCQGGPDHAYPEPTVDFLGGDQGAGLRALGVAVQYGLPVVRLRQSWWIRDGLPVEMVWQLVFADSIRDGIDDPIAHGMPLPGTEVTTCCGIAPWDVPHGERLTNDVGFITCPARN